MKVPPIARIRCPRCDGRGYVLRGANLMTRPQARLPCSMCDGTGDRTKHPYFGDGYAAGYAAALAMLREPSDKLVIAVGCCSDDGVQYPFSDARNWRARLRAAASALADSAGEEPVQLTAPR